MREFDWTCEAARRWEEWGLGDGWNSTTVDDLLEVAVRCKVKFEPDADGRVQHTEGWQFKDGSLIFNYGETLDLADAIGLTGGGWYCTAM